MPAGLSAASARRPLYRICLLYTSIRHAKRHLSRWSRTNLLVGNAESIPAPDASFDVVTSIFMFHELPPEVRRTIFGECARVLKPGGRLVLVDSLQPVSYTHLDVYKRQS